MVAVQQNRHGRLQTVIILRRFHLREGILDVFAQERDSNQTFRIGRERSKVDYCISDNTAIGRLHAIIISRNGEAYLVDQDSVNGTSVNDVKASPRQETKLRSGDKITLADEDFTFNF